MFAALRQTQVFIQLLEKWEMLKLLFAAMITIMTSGVTTMELDYTMEERQVMSYQPYIMGATDPRSVCKEVQESWNSLLKTMKFK